MFTADGDTRPQYKRLLEMFARMPQEEIERCKKAADLSFLTQGITFTVYGDEQGTERIIPYRSAAAHHHARRSGTQIERGPDPAHHRAEYVPARHL